jgi:hypothetical protein
MEDTEEDFLDFFYRLEVTHALYRVQREIEERVAFCDISDDERNFLDELIKLTDFDEFRE